MNWKGSAVSIYPTGADNNTQVPMLLFCVELERGKKEAWLS